MRARTRYPVTGPRISRAGACAELSGYLGPRNHVTTSISLTAFFSAGGSNTHSDSLAADGLFLR